MLRILVLAILICCVVSFGFAQDSVKKAVAVKPQVVNPPLLKPVPKYKTYKYHTGKYSVAKANPAATVPVTSSAVQLPAPVKRDTAVHAPVLTDKSLNGQYQYLLTKVYHYQQPLIAAFWKNAVDTLNINRHKIKDAQEKLNIQAKTTDSLKADISAKDQSLSTSNARVDAVNMFGLLLPKTTYNLIMWGLVLLFGITAFIVIARSGSYSREAKYRTKLYGELEEEFKAYKTKANDKEKKLARELQTERNKLDELLGKG